MRSCVCLKCKSETQIRQLCGFAACLCLHNKHTSHAPPPYLYRPRLLPHRAILHLVSGYAVVKRRNFCVYGAKLRNEQNSTTTRTTTTRTTRICQTTIQARPAVCSWHIHTHTLECTHMHVNKMQATTTTTSKATTCKN